MRENAHFSDLQGVFNRFDLNVVVFFSKDLLIEIRFNLWSNNAISCSVVTHDWSPDQDAIDVPLLKPTCGINVLRQSQKGHFEWI